MFIKSYLTARIAQKANTDENFNAFITKSVQRHLSGDWGDTCLEDAELNDKNPSDSMSSYKYNDDCIIWVKRENDTVIVLFPSEY